MRVLLVLFALVATPFLVSAAQDPNGLKCTNGQSADNRSAQGAAHAHKGVCKPQPPPRPVLQLSLGTGTIEGNVYNTALSWPNNGLGNWCIHVTGVTETGATVEAMQLTGASGYYLFTGLPAGTYTVCEVTEGTTCLTSFFLGDGWGASWNNFYTSPL